MDIANDFALWVVDLLNIEADGPQALAILYSITLWYLVTAALPAGVIAYTYVRLKDWWNKRNQASTIT